MKAVVRVFMVSLVIAPSAVAHAATCIEIVQNVRNLAANISTNSSTYWGHRKSYREYVFGRSRLLVEAKTRALDEKSKGELVRQPMQQTLVSFRTNLQAARSQKCLSEDELRAVQEKTIDMARSVNFDHFPEEELEAKRR